MAYKFDEHVIGYPPIELVTPVPPVLTPYALPISGGSIYTAEDPVWGPGEFVYARAGAGIRLFGGCQFLPVWDATNKVYTMNMIEWTATANAGRPLYIYQGNTALTTGQYGWFMTSGISPLDCTASIAAGVAFGHNAAGQGTADAATFGVEGALTIAPGTTTFTTAMLGGNVGSNQIFVASTQGLFPGVFVSGTGVGAAARVSFVDPLGKYILVTVVNTATPISGNLTALYNNATIFYNVIHCNRMHGADEA